MRARIDAVIEVVLIVLMGSLVINVVWQVVSRYLLNSPSPFTDELARFLLIWVSLLGAAYGSGKNIHLAIDIFPNRLTPGSRLKLSVLIDLLVIGFVLSVLVIGGGVLVYHTYAYLQLTPTLRLPMAYIYLIGPISGLLIIYYKLSDLRRTVRALIR